MESENVDKVPKGVSNPKDLKTLRNEFLSYLKEDRNRIEDLEHKFHKVDDAQTNDFERVKSIWESLLMQINELVIRVSHIEKDFEQEKIEHTNLSSKILKLENAVKIFGKIGKSQGTEQEKKIKDLESHLHILEKVLEEEKKRELQLEHSITTIISQFEKKLGEFEIRNSDRHEKIMSKMESMEETLKSHGGTLNEVQDKIMALDLNLQFYISLHREKK